jgi:palmitoyl-protein thioesterase
LSIGNAVEYTPIVLWHGMGDCCCNPGSMGYIKKLLQTNLPGVYVHSLMLGDNVFSDTEHGYFSNMNDMVEKACEKIKGDDKLKDGYNLIGFSQGGLFVRALTQRCAGPTVKTLISIGGPQQGIYGLPFCLGTKGVCDVIRHLLNYGAYESFVQKTLVQAQFWHDPYQKDDYRDKSIFLADLNCERTCSNGYKSRMTALKNFVLVKFSKDEMIVPKDSEWFGYYPENNSSVVLQMEDTTLYKQDTIGLKTLKESNRLHLLEVQGEHLQISATIFVREIIKKYLSY